MPKANNEAVADIACFECGALSPVKQNTKGALYYTCVQGCGCYQSNGARPQTRIFYLMKPRAGVDIERPRNVPEVRPDWLDGKPEPIAPEPKQEKAPEPTPEPTKTEEKTKGAPIGALFAMVAGVAVLLLPIMGAGIK